MLKKLIYTLIAVLMSVPVVYAISGNWHPDVNADTYCLQIPAFDDVWCFDSTGGVDYDPAATNHLNITTGNLKVGNGTPGVTQNGEDAYVEGTLEVDGAVTLDGALTTNSSLTIGASGSVDLNGVADSLIVDADADTTISAPTDDQIDIELKSVDHVVLKAVATADSAATTNIGEIAFTTPVDTTGTNTHQGLVIDAEIGNASGGTNTVNLLNVDAITGDAQVTLNAINIGALTGTAAAEKAIVVGSGWDTGVDISSSSILMPFEDVTAANVLTTAECGKTMMLNSATEFATTLPTPTAGCWFKFIIKAAPATDGSYTIVSSGGADVIVVEVNELETDTNDDGPWDDNADTVTFVQDISDEGDHLQCISDGTKWYCDGTVQNDGALTTATS